MKTTVCKRRRIYAMAAATVTAVILASGSAQGATVTLNPTIDGCVDDATSYAKQFELSNFYTTTAANENWRAFLQFDLSGIPVGMIITHADLRLYLYSSGAHGHIEVFRINAGPWDATTAGSTIYNLAATSVAVDSTKTLAYHTYDVTTTVSGWYAGTPPNYGFGIRGAEGNFTGTRRYFYSVENAANKPQLVVTYAVPDPPSDIALSSSTVAENEPSGTTVGTLSTTGGNTPYTYTLVAGAGDDDNASFDISGDDLVTQAAFDYERKNSYSIRVRTTDDLDATFEKALTITVTDVNEPPIMMAAAEVQTGTTAVGTVQAYDPDTADTLVYSISGGADAGAFSIGPGSGELTIPGGAGATGTKYYVEVTVTDGVNLSDAILIEVTAVGSAVPAGTIFIFR